VTGPRFHSNRAGNVTNSRYVRFEEIVGDFLKPRFWPTSGLPTTRPELRLVAFYKIDEDTEEGVGCVKS
jgi:hypothetical protein